MKSAEEVAGEIDIPCQCCCGDGYICTPHKNIALALRAARAKVWEEAANIALLQMFATDVENPQDAVKIAERIANQLRARLSEPPRGPGQGEEGR